MIKEIFVIFRALTLLIRENSTKIKFDMCKVKRNEVNDDQTNVTIERVSGDDQTFDDQSSIVVVRQRRMFSHFRDWPGCERSFRRFGH